MSTFASLLTYTAGKAPDESQREARKSFPGALKQSRLHRRMPRRSVSPTATLAIIGVATYSADELHLLDLLDDSVENRGGKPRIEVFDVTHCSTTEDFEKFIPGIGAVFRTPVLGVFVGGVLVEQATGMADVVASLRRFRMLDQRVPA